MSTIKLKMSLRHSFNSIVKYTNLGTVKTFKRNEYVYKDEDIARNIFFILEGKIRIAKYSEQGEEQLRYIVSKGDFFGEKAILGTSNRTDFAKVMLKTKVIVFYREHILEIMRKENNLKKHIYEMIYNRYHRLEKRLFILQNNDIKTRLWLIFEELQKMHSSYCEIESRDLIIEHPYNQNDLAKLIRTSRTRLNRAMQSLQELELITYKNYEIKIRNV